ncbi:MULTISPECIES: glycosyl transferase [Pseudomonadati]|uniref:Glycosyl transferase n=1 Tax=Shewanella aestuarii TaxID=1028752 RepID=A0ABT0L4N7_9GAMM|nr:glycosyl transferase [Shewanella aestuarii]MCL1118707.1 glycosyl transferase [Shewanella aestuarii]GGN67827.1 hypothetical protein GCM10009193_00130 [Shewanella aestuarii]
MPKSAFELTHREEFDFRLLIKALGKGEKGSRTLTFAESSLLIQGFAKGKVTQAQMACAMMLMRVRGETAAEVAGVVCGLKHTIDTRWQAMEVDLDWPVYAGKREQLSWLLLVAKVLATKGLRVMLHGDSLALPHRRHVESCIEALNISSAKTVTEAEKALQADGIVYVHAGVLAPVLDDCRLLHQELGLRSFIQTASRCMNPTNAALSLRSYFHPGLDDLHQSIAEMLFAEGVYQQGAIAIFKGLQGETEINPRVTTDVRIIKKTADTLQLSALTLPTVLQGFSGAKVGQSELSAHSLAHLWHTALPFESIMAHEMTRAMIEQALSSVEATLCLVLSLQQAMSSRSIDVKSNLLLAQKCWAERLSFNVANGIERISISPESSLVDAPFDAKDEPCAV